MNESFYAKFKAANELQCLLCSKYASCGRFTLHNCFSINKDMAIDFVNTFPGYFDSLKKDAKRKLEK